MKAEGRPFKGIIFFGLMLTEEGPKAVSYTHLKDMAAYNELFLEVYSLFTMAAWEKRLPSVQDIKEALYWHISDYCDQTVVYRIRECLDPSLSFATDIIREADFSDIRYLYYFGEYISDQELKTAEFLGSLPQETIDKMADTYTEGYRNCLLYTSYGS